MSGARGGRGRLVAMVVGLVLALLLALASGARAGKYSVAQCGWHVGADAAWADTTGSVKFRPDSYCATPVTADPFADAHLKTFTRSGQATVSGTRFGRWRWEAPAGTAITRVSGSWWHALHDGIEQRIGVINGGNGFDVFAAASTTDTTPRDFVAGFSPGRPALEDRLLCAKAESKSCSLEPGSWSAVRALTITLEDNSAPYVAFGGDLTGPGWRRGVQSAQFWGTDSSGSGVRFGETTIDGARVGLTEYACNKVSVAGEWRGTTMRPCPLASNGVHTVNTASFSDGPHALVNCESDFAANVTCTPARTLLIDNNPPAHPRNLAVAGGDVWHRVDDFDLAWENPDQGPASPIAGASWRVTGPEGFDSGVHFTAGMNLSSLRDLSVPHAGIYSASVWLRDEAGNEAPTSAVPVALRFDDVPPGVAFAATDGPAVPDTIRADVVDSHSAPAAGEIHYRRLGNDAWVELPSKLQPGASPDKAQLVAPLPDSLGPGTYVFRADAADAAGNRASTTRRADGTEMSVRKVPPAVEPKAAAAIRGKTRIFARLSWHRHRGGEVTVPYGVSPTLTGRLVDGEGAGLARRRLRVVLRPSRGAVARVGVERIRTGIHGGFLLKLDPGPSRRVTVSFRGEERLEPARRPGLSLRVRGSVDLHASPSALANGELLKLWGRVRGQGAPVPRRGKLIAIQYLERETGLWRPILVTRSDHSGHFTARYRFRYITGSARIRLRAVALAEERWPFAPGASRSIVVRVGGPLPSDDGL